MLSWSHVEERISAARNYWVATTRPDGRPHLTPVWGLWVDWAFYFGGTPRSRKARNLAENPNVAVHPESYGVVVILEGVAEAVTDPDPALSERVAAASTAKYGVGSSEIEGSYAVRPRVVFAWLENDFPNTATRWFFERD
jgi:nitroimidazol reductase NimA-like FMN-containing flavoprotein (pyridoxamine 5'-phosphate oxidase superfamily)